MVMNNFKNKFSFSRLTRGLNILHPGGPSVSFIWLSNEWRIPTIESEILLVWGLNSITRCFEKVGGSGGNGWRKHSMQILWSLNIIAKLKKTRVGFVWVGCFACALQSPDSIAKCKKPSHKSGFNGLEGGRASNRCWELCVDFAELQHHQNPQRFNSKCYCLMFFLSH